MLIATNWWSMLIRGIVAILLGVVTFIWPEITFAALVLWFGAFALVDGIVNLAGAFRASMSHERWGALVLEGIVGIAAGVLTFVWPGITALALVFVIATWAMVTGVLEVVAAVRLRQYISGEWLLALSGVLSIILAVLFFSAPAAGALAIALWFGIYAFIFGIVEVALAFRLRAWKEEHPRREDLLPRAA